MRKPTQKQDSEPFARVPLCVLRQAGALGLEMAELALVACLFSFRRGSATQVWPAADTLGRMLGRRRQWVSATMNNLIRKGLLKQQQRRRRASAVLDLSPLLEKARSLDVRGGGTSKRELRCPHSGNQDVPPVRTETDSIPEVPVRPMDSSFQRDPKREHQPVPVPSNGTSDALSIDALTSAQRETVHYLEAELDVWPTEGDKMLRALAERFGGDGVPEARALAEDILDTKTDLRNPGAYWREVTAAIASGDMELPDYLIIDPAEWGPGQRGASP